jgi:hypothetical protein
VPWALAALIAGCAGDTGSAGSGRAQVADSAGIRIVRNGDVGLWGAAPPVVTEVLRIGVIDGDERYQFHEVYSLAVDAEGRIFAGNNQTGSVRAFDSAGAFLAEFGRRGRGPGEFIMVNVVWLAGDSVVVTDWQGAGRTALFTKDGQLVDTWIATRADGSHVSIEGFGPGGWIAGHRPRWAQPPLESGEPWVQNYTLRRFDAATDSVGDVVYTLPPYVLYGSGAAEGVDWALFTRNAGYAFDARGNFFISEGQDYRIDIYDDSGRWLRSIRRAFEPRPIGPSDIDELKALVTERNDTIQPTATRNPRRELESVLRRIDTQATFPIPSFQAPLGNLLVSHDGSFWVERADLAPPARVEFERLYGGFDRGQPRSTRWDLYDATGQFLATVDLDTRFTPMAVRGTTVTGVLKDELDVEYIVSYAVAPG